MKKAYVIPTVLVIALFFSMFIPDGFSASPSLFLRCEGNMDSENGLTPQQNRSVLYGPGVVGTGAQFTRLAFVVFENSGIWTREQGTFAAWVKPTTDYNTDIERHDIFAAGIGINFFLSWNGGLLSYSPTSGDFGGTLNFATNPTAGDHWINTTTPITSIFNDNDWHHVACTWGPAGKKVYVDGELKETDSDYSQLSESVNQIIIGANNHYGEGYIFHLSSWIDEVRFYTTQLSDSDILEIYSSEASGGTTDGGTGDTGDTGDTGGTGADGQCATFDIVTNTFHIPCFSIGTDSYWIDMSLASLNPTQFELSNYGQGITDTQCSTFDAVSNILHIPCYSVGTDSYWIDMGLFSSDPVIFELRNYGENE
ncbi:MAG: LamG domain-containing protein [Deltaproteobacteria bacterium]|nr:LamG domain-containing protein [Deltaproteobacteria bacterium]